MSNSFTFSAEVWEYNGDNSWHFITIPVEIGKTIKTMDDFKRGFGSVRVIASVGSSRWQTSIFPDTKSESYLLPLKKEIRINENIKVGDTLDLSLIPLHI